VEAFNPWKVPLINTIILLSSGVRVTWSHHALIEGNFSNASQSLVITIVLGIYFTSIQLLEYVEAPFTISDSSFGRTFFVATGFHGLHVLVGTLFLMATIIRISLGSLRPKHHFGFEASAWYWHFVDVVWLFLFITIYWWGGKM
jgi:heme/copper-type cytochrome/quinol oxidase subunit 3